MAIVGKKTRVVVPDMIGFGQSDKPKTGTFKDNYSLMTQADMYEAIAKEEGLTNVILVAHDMGQTVGAELMARHDEGKLSFKIKHAHCLTQTTKSLRLPLYMIIKTYSLLINKKKILRSLNNRYWLNVRRSCPVHGEHDCAA